MDFMVRLLRVKGGSNVLKVIVDWLIKSVDFIAVKDIMNIDQLG